MRWIAALLTSAAAALLAGPALAADDGQQALFGTAFSQTFDFHSGARYQPGQGLVRWTSDEAASFAPGGGAYLDTVRVSTATVLPAPGLDGGGPRPQAFEVTYVRRWPAVVSMGKGRLTFDITPHAGLGVSSGGGRSAEAGALLRMMKAMGVRGAQAPRWYVYGGYRKQATGLNLARADEVLRRDRLSDDGTVKEIQAGLGARRGRFHALLGYTHERIFMRSLGEQTRDDDRVGLNLLIR